MADKSWRVRIDEARDRGEFTNDDKECAGRWSCCAVGGFVKAQGKTPLARGPATQFLRSKYGPTYWNEEYLEDPEYLIITEWDDLGGLFGTAVWTDNIERASDIFEQIEEMGARAVSILGLSEA